MGIEMLGSEHRPVNVIVISLKLFELLEGGAQAHATRSATLSMMTFSSVTSAARASTSGGLTGPCEPQRSATPAFTSETAYPFTRPRNWASGTKKSRSSRSTVAPSPLFDAR
jgi:hypothetical protein